MCPHILTDAEKVYRDPNYVGLFEEFLEGPETKQGGAIDLLCITGDISNGAHADEFRLADSVIERIAKKLNIPDESIFFVPGNHDVHWPVMQLAPSDFWEAMKYAPLLQKTLKFHTYLSHKKAGAFDEHPHFVLWDHPKAFVIAINSAAYDGPEVKNHAGIFKQSSVDALKQMLQLELPANDERLRLCLIHHHPIQYSEPSPDAQDVSILTNAENLLNTLTEFKFDLLLHGHKHHPRLNTHSGNNVQPYVTMGGGSFSATLYPVYYGSLANLFHVININGRNKNTRGIEGSVQTWMFNPKNKWQPSHVKMGMPHTEVFGAHFSPSEIEAKVGTIVATIIADQSVCSVEDLEREDSQLKHVRRTALYAALKAVSDAQGLKMIGDEDASELHWAVFKQKGSA